MSISTVYLVNGSNRGIGFGIIERLLTKSNVIIFAGVRDPANATALNGLAEKNKNLFVLKMTLGDVAEHEAAIKTIEEKAGKLDVVIANAGVYTFMGSVLETPISEFQSHFEVNTIGMVVLFQAAAPLLLKSAAPKFVLISTAGASMGLALPFPVGAYGGSKAFANLVLVKINSEHSNLATLAIHPGIVQSESGNAVAKKFGMEQAPTTILESTTGIVKLVDEVTKEKGGKFIDATTGDVIPW